MFQFYLENEYWFAATQLTLAMLGMGATIAPRDFGGIVKAPRAFGIGMVTQVALVPLIGALYLSLVPAPVPVLLAMAIVLSIPGGTLSNVMVFLARGDAPLSIALTVVATLACLLTTPVVLSFLAAESLPASFSMPAARIAGEIATFLLLPLLIGMAILRASPRIAKFVEVWGIRASFLVIGVIVVGSLGAGRIDFEALGIGNFFIVIGLFATVSIFGAVVPILLAVPRTDAVAIQIEVMLRNVNLGVLLAASLFPASTDGEPNPASGLVLFSVLLYGGAQVVTGPPVVALMRWIITDRVYGALRFWSRV